MYIEGLFPQDLFALIDGYVVEVNGVDIVIDEYNLRNQMGLGGRRWDEVTARSGNDRVFIPWENIEKVVIY